MTATNPAIAQQLHWWARPDARRWRCPPASAEATRFHQALPGYAPTPLVEVPSIAAELGVGRVFVKDESARFDVAAFKFLGASWAVCRVLSELTGYPGGYYPDGLAAWLAGREPILLVAATDGNHGCSVARMARLLGLPARVYLPDVVPKVVIDRVAAQGAEVAIVPGSYDDALDRARSGAAADHRAVLIQDTAWDGYIEIPARIVEGYATALREIDAQLADRGVAGPDLVSVPVGVGSLAQACVTHYRSRPAGRPPAMLSVEPETAACVLRSLASGRIRAIRTGCTVMNGLNCGTPSLLAWPYLRDGLDAAVAVSDGDALRAVETLAAAGIVSGPSGAASLAGVRAALAGPDGARHRRDLGLGAGAVLVCLSTEGFPATPDPARPSGLTAEGTQDVADRR